MQSTSCRCRGIGEFHSRNSERGDRCFVRETMERLQEHRCVWGQFAANRLPPSNPAHLRPLLSHHLCRASPTFPSTSPQKKHLTNSINTLLQGRTCCELRDAASLQKFLGTAVHLTSCCLSVAISSAILTSDPGRQPGVLLQTHPTFSLFLTCDGSIQMFLTCKVEVLRVQRCCSADLSCLQSLPFYALQPVRPLTPEINKAVSSTQLRPTGYFLFLGAVLCKHWRRL